MRSPWSPCAACELAKAELIDWSLYHKADETLEFFRSASRALPGRVRYEEVQDPDSQFKLPVVTLTNFSTGVVGKEVILVIAGEHARELITSEVVYWLGSLLTGQRAEELTEWAALQPIQATAWKNGWTKGTLGEWGDHILTRVIFKIFPVQNIAGRKAVESGTACLRKTISGVDLNRNWPHAWKQGSEGADEYGGPHPCSEPETRIVRLVAENTDPSAFVNLHSGEWAMYVPWDSLKALAPGLPADTPDLLEKMNAFCKCMNGAAGATAGYLAEGTSMDWMYAEQHVAYPLTFEVFGPRSLGRLSAGGHPRRRQLGDQDGDRGCLDAYNPPTREEYQAAVAEWLGALLVLADHVAAHPHASAASHAAEQRQLPEPDPPPTRQDLLRQGESVAKAAHDEAVQQGFHVELQPLGRKAGDGRASSGREASTAPSFVSRLLLMTMYAALGLTVGGLVMAVWMALRVRLSRQTSPSRQHTRHSSARSA